jgi:glycosyltransferase involved in cell wall biosynthesis
VHRGLRSLGCSLADQNFVRTKSLGILNLSLQLAEVLCARSEIPKLELFSNSSLREWHVRFRGRPVHCFDKAFDTRLGRVLWDQQRVYGEARKRDLQWLLLPKGFASFCRRPPIKLAAYVHDVIGEWYRQHYPDTGSRSEAWYFRRSLLATLKHATVIFTNSNFTRTELVRFSERTGIRPPDIVVAGIGFDAVQNPRSGKRNRIVVLASPLRHKRTDLAVEYMAEWQRTADFTSEVQWVGRFPSTVCQPRHPGWEYHERMDERAYRSMLADSKILVYFSEYEGFGMPPVEAVLHGVCPVYSAVPATRETMDDAGAPFEITSFESFVAAMNKALRIEPQELASVAGSLRRRHNWSAVGDRIIGALDAHSALA